MPGGVPVGAPRRAWSPGQAVPQPWSRSARRAGQQEAAVARAQQAAPEPEELELERGAATRVQQPAAPGRAASARAGAVSSAPLGSQQPAAQALPKAAASTARVVASTAREAVAVWEQPEEGPSEPAGSMPAGRAREVAPSQEGELRAEESPLQASGPRVQETEQPAEPPPVVLPEPGLRVAEPGLRVAEPGPGLPRGAPARSPCPACRREWRTRAVSRPGTARPPGRG